jgi:hypothetical protein
MNARQRDKERKTTRPQDRMLADFLRAPTAEQKRKVIEQFAPFYFALTPKENEDERLQASS